MKFSCDKYVLQQAAASAARAAAPKSYQDAEHHRLEIGRAHV